MGKDVFFYSITIDPENDTPEVLAEFVDNWGIPGLEVPDRRRGRHHPPAQEAGDLHRRDPAEDSKRPQPSPGDRQPGDRPLDEALAVREPVRAGRPSSASWLHGWKLPSKVSGLRGRPRAAPDLDGETALPHPLRLLPHDRQRGRAGDGRAAHRAGSLHVVEQRDRAWLERWLMEPDVDAGGEGSARHATLRAVQRDPDAQGDDAQPAPDGRRRPEPDRVHGRGERRAATG
jgi:protein SCO1